MAQAFITVRMESGGEPQITVSAREAYFHEERGEQVEATLSVDAELKASLSERLQKALQAVLDDVADETEAAGRRAAIRGASAAMSP